MKREPLSEALKFNVTMSQRRAVEDVAIATGADVSEVMRALISFLPVLQKTPAMITLLQQGVLDTMPDTGRE